MIYAGTTIFRIKVIEGLTRIKGIRIKGIEGLTRLCRPPLSFSSVEADLPLGKVILHHNGPTVRIVCKSLWKNQRQFAQTVPIHKSLQKQGQEKGSRCLRMQCKETQQVRSGVRSDQIDWARNHVCSVRMKPCYFQLYMCIQSCFHQTTHSAAH